MIELELSGGTGSFPLDARCRAEAPVTVIFGPSGAGKSTVLRMIAGLARPRHGWVRLNGRTLTDTAQRIHQKPGRRGVGMAAQQAALFPHKTVAGNVGFGLRMLNETERRTRIAESLAVTGAESLAERRVTTLSGGEAQRVALARALAPRPELLLLDEPLSALDTPARDAVMAALLAWLDAHAMQTILVTHDAADALRARAEVVRMQEGQIVAQGAAMEVLADERRRLLERLTAAQ